MKTYQSPEGVEMGSASDAILTAKDVPIGDNDTGSMFPHFPTSVVDRDE